MLEYESKGRRYAILTGVIGAPAQGRFMPFFTVRQAGQNSEAPLHRRDHDQWESSFRTQGEALAAARTAAIEWIEAHSGDEKGNG